MKRKEKQRQHKEGFTLIEILLVVVIIGILAALAAPRLGGRVKDAQISAAKSDINAIGVSIDLYEMDNGDYPANLQALVQNSGGKNWKGPYLKKGLPKDPWGNDYIYQYPGAQNPQGYDLKSLGPDGAASADDLANY